METAPFGGEAERWPEWSFSARAFFIAAGLANKSRTERELALRDALALVSEVPNISERPNVEKVQTNTDR